MSEKLLIGDKIRPWGGFNYGTLGFFCSDDRNDIFFATCDHVIKTVLTKDSGPSKVYFPFGSDYSKKIGVFEGNSLVSKDIHVADIALVRVSIDVMSRTKLPSSIPSTDIATFQAVSFPSKGDEVLLWGSRTATYHSGVVLARSSSHSWPHAKYGLVKYDKQFSVVLSSPIAPEIGDSGGFVITADGSLLGLIAALSGIVSDAGNPIIHCVPVKECCELLGVKPIINNG